MIKKINAIQINQFINENQSQFGEFPIISLKSSDSYLERIIIKKLSFLNCKIINAKEITSEWLVENTSNYDLFSAMENESGGGFFIINSESLDSDGQDYLIDLYKNLTKKIVLLFNKKTEFFTRLSKLDSTMAVEVTVPKAKEMGRYLMTYLNLLGVECENGIDVPQFKDKDFSPGEIAQIAETLTVEAGNRKITRSMVSQKLDAYLDSNFKLFDYLNEKNFERLYEALSKVSNDSREFRSKVLMLQGHLFKIKYPSYLEHKNKKPSFFDDKIIQANHRWSKQEIQSFLKELSELESATKLKFQELDKIIKTKKGRRLASPLS